ncbi:unnamed protein product [Urochloa humidicola]
MEAKPPMQQLRTPMDPLASLASTFSPLLSPSPQHQQGSTFLLLPLPVAAAARALTVLRRLLLLATQAFISLFFIFLSALFPAPPPPPYPPTLPRIEPTGSPASDTCAGRALAHVLSVASRLPVSSRKYELVRGLAERLLDDNARDGGARVAAVSRAALAGAFARTLRQLESAAAGGEWPPGVELAVRAVRTGMRWWWRPAAAAAADEGFGGPAAEKLAAELLWLGQKMAECGAAREAVVQFGDAARLGSRALVADPALQVSLLRLAAVHSERYTVVLELVHNTIYFLALRTNVFAFYPLFSPLLFFRNATVNIKTITRSPYSWACILTLVNMISLKFLHSPLHVAKGVFCGSFLCVLSSQCIVFATCIYIQAYLFSISKYCISSQSSRGRPQKMCTFIPKE